MKNCHDLSQVVVLAIANVSIKYVQILCDATGTLHFYQPAPIFFSPLPIAGKVTNCLNRLIVYIVRLYDYLSVLSSFIARQRFTDMYRSLKIV